MDESTIRIIIADDSNMNRIALKRIFETTSNIKVIGEVTNAQETLRVVQNNLPDILIMDLSWYSDESAGRMAIKEIKAAVPKIKILAITAYESLIADARKAGADASLTRVFEIDQLIRMVEALFQRTDNFSEKQSDREIFDDLSPREKEVLNLLVDGYQDKEIAEKLIIAESTAKNHVKNILSKLNARNRVEAIKRARDLGILQ